VGISKPYRLFPLLLFWLFLTLQLFGFVFSGNHFQHNYPANQITKTHTIERFYNHQYTLTQNNYLQFFGVGINDRQKKQELNISSEALPAINKKRPLRITRLAITIYSALFVAAAFGVRKYEISRIRLKNQMLLMHLEANKLKEVDQLKSRFYANISHELRTPLTLIKGPVEQMMDQATGADKSMLKVIHANTNRLLTLINQLLELSKLESGEYKIRVSRGDIVGCIKEVVTSFNSFAKEKKITLRFVAGATVKSQQVSNNFYFSKDAIENIFINLLHNALKFTPTGGTVTVTVCLHISKNRQDQVEITIKDTGPGIPRDKIPFIYNRYFQIDNSLSKQYEGTGIGLAYVKELVEIHKGHIAVMSKPRDGTTFRIRFPLGVHHFIPDQIDPEAHTSSTPQLPAEFHTTLTIPAEDAKREKEQPIILIVEDFDELRNYIKSILLQSYNIIEASNGGEGLKLAIKVIPDLIISDIIMPGIDGFAFCEKIKSHEATSHIPVILLTAMADTREVIRGLETGADDYLTKPFNSIELRFRVKNMIESRLALRAKFDQNMVVKPEEILISSRDSDLIEKLLRVVESNMANERFSVEMLSGEAGMSPSQLHRKLKAIIGQSAIHFIRAARMHRARDLLERNAGNISEIAYMTGFSDPGYFSKTFRAFFGYSPSAFRKKTKT